MPARFRVATTGISNGVYCGCPHSIWDGFKHALDGRQKLLEICRFVEVKRLFMYMAEKHRHPWVEKVDLSRIDFGRGKRRIVSGGALDPKYQITVPRERREGTV